MVTIVLIIHVFIVIALVGVVLMQRSEGGALGIGGGGPGGFMSSRGAANTLTRLTTGLGALFFATSLGLAMFADRGVEATDLQRELTGEDASALTSGGGVESDDLLQSLGDALNTGEEEAEDLLPAPSESTPQEPDEDAPQPEEEGGQEPQ